MCFPHILADDFVQRDTQRPNAIGISQELEKGAPLLQVELEDQRGQGHGGGNSHTRDTCFVYQLLRTTSFPDGIRRRITLKFRWRLPGRRGSNAILFVRIEPGDAS